MTWSEEFESAAAEAAAVLSASHLRTLADRLGAGWPTAATVNAVPVPGFAQLAMATIQAARATGISDPEAAAYLRGLAAGRSAGQNLVRIESVWSGPGTHQVPVRATAQVLVDVIAEARYELLMMTYSARAHSPVLSALTEAVSRGVVVSIVVETLAGAGGALHGPEPADAFASVAAVKLWHWPPKQRTESGARTHAKIAVADRRTLLVSSANLTQSGVGRNIEAGLLVRGGTAPQRAAEHITQLQTAGVLVRLRRGE
ncbi:DISARM system phospholipase D-like protein DrmC [Catellatospora sichuanensis]|uniref:DISARM system phospholipase D-like protein DrmC n=1 Tax=Catellatospora sichuanensis TaxID=1969805 RepID=UPI0011829A67|nr:DISARM system phospholipase D-like protein DrmC [Catellatospora sichuanensis]